MTRDKKSRTRSHGRHIRVVKPHRCDPSAGSPIAYWPLPSRPGGCFARAGTKPADNPEAEVLFRFTVLVHARASVRAAKTGIIMPLSHNNAGQRPAAWFSMGKIFLARRRWRNVRCYRGSLAKRFIVNVVLFFFSILINLKLERSSSFIQNNLIWDARVWAKRRDLLLMLYN